ncbi:TetR/AcrR family transcriptional regulator [Caulobacter sp. UNC279MFTsu5.1]|uniref:TetR/AcrR family transcriptional regulator n=1 Tax=Caulobacter sp. UNC279MFTsu5.1 TaxID=1502775 RepID=UPI0008EC39B8|nr:TetR/AcrR family transcriptional regulator [Caulobacter sp. UNC279MFTsu5.1]SFJ04848.1 transcriptional regulator, TetR family [Caulobacter sp. UNC279MFTsu5.1]
MLIGAVVNRSERKKTEILAAARGVFLREGYSAAGMEAVARMAGVSTATLYAYFPSKAKLFEVVVHDAVLTMAEPVRASLGAKGDARGRLTSLALAYATFMSLPATRAIFRMVTSERRRFEAVADHFLQSAHQALGGAATQVVEDLIASGELAAAHPAWAAGQLLGMLDHATLVLGLAAGDETLPARPLRDISEEAVETFLARYGV